MFPCELKEFPAQKTLSIRFHAPVEKLTEHFGRVYGAIMQYLGEVGAQPTGAAFAIYTNMDMTNLDVEAGFPVDRVLPGKGEIRAGEIPGGLFGVCHYTGPYDGVSAAYDALTDFAKQGGYEPGGAAYEWYLNDPGEVPTEELKTDVMFPVARITEKTP